MCSVREIKHNKTKKPTKEIGEKKKTNQSPTSFAPMVCVRGPAMRGGGNQFALSISHELCQCETHWLRNCFSPRALSVAASSAGRRTKHLSLSPSPYLLRILTFSFPPPFSLFITLYRPIYNSFFSSLTSLVVLGWFCSHFFSFLFILSFYCALPSARIWEHTIGPLFKPFFITAIIASPLIFLGGMYTGVRGPSWQRQLSVRRALIRNTVISARNATRLLRIYV